MNARPLWQYLTLKLLPIGLAIFAVSLSAQFFMAARLEGNIAASRLQQGGELYAQSVKQHFDALLSQIETISKNSIVINSLIDFEGRRTYLPLYLSSVGIFDRTDIAIQLVDFSGDQVDGNFHSKTNAFPDSELWTEQVLEKGERWIKLSADGLAIAQPVYNQGLSEGAILAFVKADILKYWLNNINPGDNRLLLSQTGQVIFISEEISSYDKDKMQKNNDQWIKSNKESIDEYQLNAQLFLKKESINLSGSLSLPIILLSLALFTVSVFLIVFFGANQLKRVVFSLSSAIEKTISTKDLKARVEDSESPKELIKLGTQFNQMMDQLESTTSTLDEVDAILHSMREWVVVCDYDLNVLLTNKIVSSGDTQKQSLSQLIGVSSYHNFCRNDAEVVEYEQKQAGKIILWRKTQLILRGENSGWIFTGSDISEIKQAQHQANILSLAVDSASNGVVVVDACDSSEPIIFVNKGFSEITGFLPAEVLGRRCDFLQGKETDPKVRRKLAQSIKNNQAVEVEIINYRKNGEKFWNHLAIDPVVDENNKVTHFLGIIRDINSVVEARNKLKVAMESAKAATIAKNEFLASMSHEIRTPMNGVIGMLGLLLKSPMNVEQESRVKIAESSAKSLLVLINDILDFSKIEAKKIELESLDFNLIETVGEVAKGIAIQAHDKGLELVLDLSGVQTSIVKGDSGRIRQILNNLLSNAIKFTSKGEVYIELSLNDDGGRWQLTGSVKDTGIGIPEDKLSKLFQAFTQVDASTTRRFGGTGLGLVIVRRLCQIMGGDIVVKSDLGKGSCFNFNFYLDKADRAWTSSTKMGDLGLNVLIVEDSDVTAQVLAKQLSAWGLNVTILKSTEQVLSMSEQGFDAHKLPAFDLALVSMGVVHTGEEAFLKAMSSDKYLADMKIILMAPMTFQDEIDPLLKLGFSGVYSKPITPIDLISAIELITSKDGAEMAGTIKKAGDNPLGSPFKNSQRLPQFPQNTKLLLVDDNPINLMVAEGMLEDFDLKMVCASNGKEALSQLENSAEEPFSLVLMDCQMPEMDGFEATRQIRAGAVGNEYKKIPVIAMTANAMLGDKEKCIAVGMSDYLAKPIDATLFIEKLEHWLAREAH